jgi:hypothetical protein
MDVSVSGRLARRPVAGLHALLAKQPVEPARDPVGFVGSVKPVRKYSKVLYRLDFKHIFGMPCDLV